MLGRCPERSSRMNEDAISAAAKAVVRRNTEEVQGKGNFDVFEELFADDFVDHTTQPGTSPDKAGVRNFLGRGCDYLEVYSHRLSRSSGAFHVRADTLTQTRA